MTTMEPEPKSLTLAQYAENAKSTAFFLKLDQPENIIVGGLREEIAELLTCEDDPDAWFDLRRILLGQLLAHDVPDTARRNFESEVGDILYYIEAINMLLQHNATKRGDDQPAVTLEAIGKRSIELLSGSSPKEPVVTFSMIDRSAEESSSAETASATMSTYGYEILDFMAVLDPSSYKPFRQVSSADYLYRLATSGLALDSSTETIFDLNESDDTPSPEMQRAHMDHAAHLLAELAIVLNVRFGSSLVRAAENNVAKRARRVTRGRLNRGVDYERSQAIDQENRPQLGDRPVMSRFDLCSLVLIEGPFRPLRSRRVKTPSFEKRLVQPRQGMESLFTS